MDDRLGHLTKDLVQFFTEKKKTLNVSVGLRLALAGGSAEAAEAVSLLPLADSGTHAAIYTSSDASLLTRLLLILGPSVNSVVLSFSRALLSDVIKHAATGAAESFLAINVRPSNQTAMDEKTINSRSDLGALDFPSVSADHLVSFAAMPRRHF